MKQSERNLQSREKILCAAAAAFGEKGYGGTSLNELLSRNGISKGLFYHYFAHKDELYLSCVTLCFDALTERLSEIEPRERGSERLLQSYFKARSDFFLARPHLGSLFFDAILRPPSHLRDQIAQIRSGFEAINRALFLAVLDQLPLRKGVSEKEALEYFTSFQSVFQLQSLSTAEQPPRTPEPSYYEKQVQKAMEILLYGLAGGIPQ